MIKMKSKSIFLTISLFSSVCFGQSSFSYGSSSSELFEVTKKINSVKSYDNNLGDIVGSAYMNDEFQSGVIFKNSESDGSWFIRYNAYNDEMEISKDINSTSSAEALLKTSEIYCVIGKDKYVFKNYTDESNSDKEGYLREVFNGNKYEVYVRDLKKFKEETKAKTTLENDTPAKFSYKYKILLAKKNNKPITIKLKSKKIINALLEGDRKLFLKKNPSIRKINNLSKFINSIKEIDKINS
tara:strand:- start:1580 stop:2302 length:723 start_codon:yes stop_codon:yes gene_type:complete